MCITIRSLSRSLWASDADADARHRAPTVVFGLLYGVGFGRDQSVDGHERLLLAMTALCV